MVKLDSAKKIMPAAAERTAKRSHAPITALCSAAAGALLTDIRIGGAYSPFAVSLVGVLPFKYGIAAVIGSLLCAVLKGSVWSCITELSAAAVTLIFRYIFSKKLSSSANAIITGIIYFTAAAAVSAASPDFILFAAALFRSVLCGLMTLCMDNAAGTFRKNQQRMTAALPAVYILAVAALCSYSIGILNIGRITAGFMCCVFARKFGQQGAAAAGILSSAAFLLCDSSLSRCASVLALASMICGMYMSKGKYSVNVAFICACFGITAAAGMPSGTPAFIADMGAAAALYCLIPEKYYLPSLNLMFKEDSHRRSDISYKLEFTSKLLEDIGNDLENASEMLLRIPSPALSGELYHQVKSMVCSGVCTPGRCSAACGGSTPNIIDGCFIHAQGIVESKGQISEKELPAGFKGCKKRVQLAEGFTHAYRLRQVQQRKRSYVRRFLDNACGQLNASGGMLLSLSDRFTNDISADNALSRAASKLAEKYLDNICSFNVAFADSAGPLCEAIIDGRIKAPDITVSELTEELGSLLGAQLEGPAVISCGDEGCCRTRLRWWGDPVFYTDYRIEACPAQNVNGDSSCCFEDGRGSFYLILADGMGQGQRAAAESTTAVSILKRLILSDYDIVSALNCLNVLLGSFSADELFTTVDILKIDCYTGKGTCVKMGAAPTYVYSGELTVYDRASAPAGIIGRVTPEISSFELDEHSRIIMATDGIGDCASYINLLLENEKLTCELTAQKLLNYSDENEMNQKSDDKTAAAIRIYRR